MPCWLTRRQFTASLALAAAGVARAAVAQPPVERKALVAITFDLEMSRHYPRRGMLEWDYEKGNLDAATKQYSLEAARLARDRGVPMHFFCVGRVLEQANLDWLREIAELGHAIGNHTYDHVHLKAATPEEAQFRFQRAPWLVQGRSVEQLLRDNIRMTNEALQQRLGLTAHGFRTPGGFADGLADRPDLQKMLLELGFRWVSSKYPSHPFGEPQREPTPELYAALLDAQSHAQPFIYPSGLIEIPMSPISDVGAFRTQRWQRSWFLEALRQAVSWAIENRAVFDFLAHPSCLVVEDPQFESLHLLCDLVQAASHRAEIVTLDEIARRAVT